MSAVRSEHAEASLRRLALSRRQRWSAGGYDTTDSQPPYIPGMDAAGVIDELGEGSIWQIGDEVMATARRCTRTGSTAAGRRPGRSCPA